MEYSTGRLKSYNDFVTALHDHKAVWLLNTTGVNF